MRNDNKTAGVIAVITFIIMLLIVLGTLAAFGLLVYAITNAVCVAADPSAATAVCSWVL